MFDFLQCVLMILGSVVVTVIVLPYSLLLIPILFVIFIYLRKYYLATSRQIKRLESVTRSPVYFNLFVRLSYFTGTLIYLLRLKGFLLSEHLMQKSDFSITSSPFKTKIPASFSVIYRPVDGSVLDLTSWHFHLYW